MSPRRKRIVITIDEKLRAIERVEKGELMKTIADELNVGTSTVSDWIKSKEKFATHATKKGRSSRYKPKIIRTGVYEAVNEALFLWFIQQREQNAPISGPILKAKATVFAVNLGDHYKSFTASEGWLSKWKYRYDIKQLGTNGEKSLADENSTSEYGKEFKEIIGEYSQDQVFSAVEAGLYFKMLPAQSVVPECEKSASSCDPITVLLCTNASGECRLPMMVIGKSKNPPLLKNIDKNNLPVYYKHLKHAWMSPTLFNNWFREHFAPKVKIYLESKGLPPKAVLLLDNAPVHPDVKALKNEDIIARYVSSKVVGFLQPFDHSVAEIFKKHYRLLMLRSTLAIGNSSSFLQNLKSISMKDAIFWSAKAWKEVKCSTIKNYWNKLFDKTSEESDEVLDLELAKITRLIPGCESITAEEITAWVNCDRYRELTDEEILNIVNKAEKDESSSGDDEKQSAEKERIYSVEAFQDSQLHFEDSQFEQNRADGRKLLKWNAVPTVFNHQNTAKTLKGRGKTRKILAVDEGEAEASVISEAQGTTNSNSSLEKKGEKLEEKQPQCKATEVRKEFDSEDSSSKQDRASKRSISQLDVEPASSNDSVPLKQIKCEPMSPQEIPLNEDTNDAEESRFYQNKDTTVTGGNTGAGTEEQVEKQQSGTNRVLEELDFEVSQPDLNYAKIKDMLKLDDEPPASSGPKLLTRIKREPLSPERETPFEQDVTKAKSSAISEKPVARETNVNLDSGNVKEARKPSSERSEERTARYPLRKRVQRVQLNPPKSKSQRQQEAGHKGDVVKEESSSNAQSSPFRAIVNTDTASVGNDASTSDKQATEKFKPRSTVEHQRANRLRQRTKPYTFRKRSKLKRQREFIARQKALSAGILKQQVASTAAQSSPICTISNVVGASEIGTASASSTSDKQIAAKPLSNELQIQSAQSAHLSNELQIQSLPSGAKSVVIRKEFRIPPGFNIANFSKIIRFKMISMKKGETTPAKDASEVNSPGRRIEIRAPPTVVSTANLPRLIRLKRTPTTEDVEHKVAVEKQITENVSEKEKEQEQEQEKVRQKKIEQEVIHERYIEQEKERLKEQAVICKEMEHRTALGKDAREGNRIGVPPVMVSLEALHPLRPLRPRLATPVCSSSTSNKVHDAVKNNLHCNVENKTNSEDCGLKNKEGEHSRRPSRRAAQLAVQKIQNITRNLANTPSEMPVPVTRTREPIPITRAREPSPEPVKIPTTTYLKMKTQVRKIRETPRPIISPPVQIGLDMECYEEMLSVIQAQTLMKAQAEYNRVVKTLRNLKANNARIVCLLNDEVRAPIPVVPQLPPQAKVAAVASSSNSHSTSVVNLSTITQSSNCTITVVPVRLVAVHNSGPPGVPQSSVTVMKPSLSSTLTTSSN